MINEDVQRRVDAYRGNPNALAQRYQMTQELLDLLALQKLKSEKEAAAREMALAMQQQGEPPTIAQQREQEVAQMSKQELAQQLGGLAQLAQQRQQPQQAPMMSGVASAPGAENVMPEQAMAAGGIVAFDDGGSVSASANEMRMPNAPDYESARQLAVSALAKLEDSKLMATASRLTGAPINSPTQARIVLEKMIDNNAFDVGVSGIGNLLPNRISGMSFGASMPAMGGRLRAGVEMPRGGSPAFNIGYNRQFANGGIVAFQAGGQTPRETYAERQDRQMREKGSIYSPYYGLNLGELQDIVAQEVVDQQLAAEQARAVQEAVDRERVQARARRASADRGTFAPEGKERTIGEAAQAIGADIASGIRQLIPGAPVDRRIQMGSQNEAIVPVRRMPGTSTPEEGTTVDERGRLADTGPRASAGTAAAAPQADTVQTLLDAAQKATARPGEVQLPSVARTPEQIAAFLTAGREPQGTQSQQEMFKTLRDYQRQVAEAQFPQMSPEAKAAREAAIRRQEERLAQEFDPERRRLDFLRDFLLGGAGRTGIGSVFAGAGASGARAMSAAEAAQREREDRIEAMREALRGKTEEEARAAFTAKQKGLETALGAEKALLDLSVKMSEGDKERGTKLAIVAQEIATKEKLTEAELRTRVQLEAQKLGVTLDIADADRLVKMAQVAASREESAARLVQAAATETATAQARQESRLGTNVRAKIDDLARVDREFSDARTKNPMLDQLLTKYEAGEALKPEQAAKVNAYLQAKQSRINQINAAYAGLGIGAATNIQSLAQQELARRQSAQ